MRIAACAVIVLSGCVEAAKHLQLLDGVQVAIHDAVSAGRLIAVAMRPSKHETSGIGPGNRDNDKETQILEQQRRRLMIENSRLHNELQRFRSSPASSQTYRPLVDYELLPARILSRQGLPDALASLMIDAGRAHGLTHRELVLDASGMLLDQGSDAGIDDGRIILTGSTVVGRVERTGRWVSQLQPVTSTDFSAQVRLIHRTSQPSSSNSSTEGILEGSGGGCRVVGVPETASVSVGDEVVSADINGITGPPLYYGTVTQAEFQSAGEWLITVRPGATTTEIERVVVVVPKLDMERITGNQMDPEQRRQL